MVPAAQISFGVAVDKGTIDSRFAAINSSLAEVLTISLRG
jgi:hypothetical protein